MMSNYYHESDLPFNSKLLNPIKNNLQQQANTEWYVFKFASILRTLKQQYISNACYVNSKTLQQITNTLCWMQLVLISIPTMFNIKISNYQ